MINETLKLSSDDAMRYGEEAAIVLYVIRFCINMHQRGFHTEEFVNFQGIPHLELSDGYFESCLSYKPIRRIKVILKRLNKLNVISIKEGNYYALRG